MFDNGSEQIYTIRYWTLEKSTIVFSAELYDPGESLYGNKTLYNLISGKSYIFIVVAENRYGESSSKPLSCTSEYQ